jgi:hypothetical protein
MSALRQILSGIEIRGPEAAWVLSAHAYALIVPIALCTAVNYHWDYLAATVYMPSLLYIAAALLCAGSAFEIAQNAFDRWYLTSDSPSANGTGFCDFLFYWLVTAGQALCAIAIGGDIWWVNVIAASTVLIFPACYMSQVAHLAPLSIASLLFVWLTFSAFGDPIVFLQLLLAATTIYFFTALLKTGAQAIHGFTTLAASSGTWCFVWALNNSAAGTPNSWAFTLSIAIAVVAAGALFWPSLTSIRASARVFRQAPDGPWAG